MKKCSKCGETKPLKKFPFKSKKKGQYNSYCFICQRNYARTKYKEDSSSAKKRASKNRRKRNEAYQKFIWNYLECPLNSQYSRKNNLMIV